MWTRNAWQSPTCSPPGPNLPAKLKGHWAKVHLFFIRHRGVIGAHLPICCGMPAHRMTVWYANFRRFVPKIGYHSKSLERSRNEGRTDHAHPYMYLFWKFGENRSSIFWDNWSPTLKKMKESNIYRTRKVVLWIIKVCKIILKKNKIGSSFSSL